MQRIAYELPIAVMSGRDSAAAFDARTRDVSATGVFFYAEIPFEVGASLEIVMDLPNQGFQQYTLKVRCSAKVVRVERLEHGRVGIAVQTEGFEFLPTQPYQA